TVTATLSDEAGNTSTAATETAAAADLFATAGTVTVNAITSDDVINATEAAGTVAVSGTATGGDIAEGDTVTLVINDTEYTTTVGADGTWTVDVAGSDLAADTVFDAVVASSDTAGNTVDSKATSTHKVDMTSNASIDVDVITGDKVISAAEAGEGNYVSITGWVGGDAQPGDTVTIELEGNVIGTAQVSSEQDSSGRYLYSVEVLGSDLANTSLANPYITAKVSGTDEAGNAFVASSTEIYKVDLVADIDAFVQDESGDMVINLDEQGNVTVGGWIELGGDVQSITITDEVGNSVTITEGITIEDDGGYGYFEIGADVSSLLDGELSVVVNASDAAGNTVQSEVMSIEKDTSAESGEVTVNAITSDDIINITESEQTVTVSGSASGGDISAGDIVTMTINGTEYSTSVQADGTWSVDVAGTDLAADTEFDVVVSSTDSAGNEVKSTVSSTHTSDLNIATPSISFESTGDDDVYNADEVGDDGTVTATISVSGSEVGDKVTYQVNNNTAVTITLTAALIESGIAVEVAPEDSITVSLSDDAGNRSVEVSGTAPAADLEAEAGTVTVNPITSDDHIDGTELYDTVTISGQASGGDISAGDQVKMVINGKEYDATVNDDGSWSVNVAASELAEDTEFDVVVTSSDAAGNTVESRGTSTHTVDLSAEVTLSAGEGQQVVLTDLPEGFTFPEGVTEVTTDFGATISLVDGEYLYQAPVRDHSDSQGDQDSVTVTLEDGRSFTVNIDVEDSAPVAVDDEADILVRRETFEVSNVEANWVSSSGGNNINKFDGTSSNGGIDNDDGKDQIRWGESADDHGRQSGYGFIDNDSELDGKFELNEDIIIGTFTHYNYPVYSGGAIDAASMEIDFSVTDNSGVSEPVKLTVNFSHNETTNIDGDAEASRDIVTVENTFVTFEWEGEIYTLQVVGFREVGNPDGEVVTSIHTYENASTSYELVVRVVEGEGYSLPETTGNVLDDNGLGADELSEDGAISVTNVASGESVNNSDASAGQSVKGTYGNLILNADGSYVYQATASVSTIPDGATDSFTYMIQDEDGSSSTATLTINVAAEAPRVEPTFFENVSANLDSDLQWFETNTGDEATVQTDGRSNYWDDDRKDTHLKGTSNDDFIVGDRGDDHIEGGNAQDTLGGYGGSDWLEGGEGDDTLYADGRRTSYQDADDSNRVDGGAGQDTLYGSIGDDFLLGGSGDDYLDGRDGDDVLIGGQGQDTMTGGDGRDLFILTDYSQGVDTITDFNASDDALDISELLDVPSSAAEEEIQAYLNENLTLTTNQDGSGKLEVADSGNANHTVANFGSDSQLGSGSITVIFNDKEYDINIDG
ncbi:Ig-like domain-containing protein, partial [Marinomonas posidonica]|uniref:Ig-like domain-containing protein n=1 Tax=Marinomonas posidonica TaxID=936476 RepID=UPI003735BD7B